MQDALPSSLAAHLSSKIQFKFLVACQSRLGDMTPSQHSELHNATPHSGSALILIEQFYSAGLLPLVSPPWYSLPDEEEGGGAK